MTPPSVEMQAVILKKYQANVSADEFTCKLEGLKVIPVIGVSTSG